MRPTREVATNNGQAHFVTSVTAGRQCFFRHDRWARLLIEVLESYRPARFLLHDFVVMPDRFHVLPTPLESLQKAIQTIKGGFSFRARRQFDWQGDLWVAGFSDHRIRDDEEYRVHQRYIHRNAVEAGLAPTAEAYPYGLAGASYPLDAFPRGLKPDVRAGAARPAPIQSVLEAEALYDEPGDAPW